MINKLSLFLLSCLVFSTFSYAEGTKVAVVDMQQVTSKSELAKKIEKKLISATKKPSKKLEQLIQKLEKKRKSVSKNFRTMTNKEKREAQESIVELEVQAKRAKEDLDRYASKQRAKLLPEIQDAANKAIKTVAEREGYQVVIYEGVAFQDDSVNITDAVIEAMND